MKPIEIALLLGAGIVGYSLIRKTAALGTLNFYPADVRDIEFDGATPVMTVGLEVQNTSNQSFTMASMAGNLFCNGYLVGNVSSFTPFVIPANSQTVINLNCRLSLLGIVNDIIRAFQTGNIKQDISLQSYANVDNLQVPINIKYTVGQ